MREQLESGRVRHQFEPVILVATLAMIPVLIIEYDTTSAGWHTFAVAANWVIWAVFAAELAFVLWVAPRKRAALRSHWLDVAIVIVTAPLYGRLLSSLRLVRLARLMRLVRAVVVIGRALQAERRLTSTSAFRFVALATVFLGVQDSATRPNREVLLVRPPENTASHRALQVIGLHLILPTFDTIYDALFVIDGAAQGGTVTRHGDSAHESAQGEPS
jgi:hypothetical protein